MRKGIISACTMGLAAGAHATIFFLKESFYAASGELIVTPKIARWMSGDDWILLGAVIVVVIGIQYWEERR
jgi:hypothetical protein